jgi:hypothetical protein
MNIGKVLKLPIAWLLGTEAFMQLWSPNMGMDNVKTYSQSSISSNYIYLL